MKIKEGRIDQTKPINPDRLHEELKARLGDKYISMDTGIPQVDDKTGKPDRTKPVQIVVRLTDDATPEDQQAVDALVESHDPALLSVTQQKDKDRNDAKERFKSADFVALRNKTGKAQTDDLINLLEDLQKIMQGETG